MKFLILLIFLNLIHSKGSECTKAVSCFVEGIYETIEEIQDNIVPSEKKLMDLFSSMSGMVHTCFHRDLDNDKIKKCVHRLYPAVASVKDLVQDIQNQKIDLIIEDAVKIASQLASGINYCVDLKEISEVY